MDSISKEQYEFAQARIEELLPLVMITRRRTTETRLNLR